MKRAAALQTLSHDHHHGLVWARRLAEVADARDAANGRLRETAAGFCDFWRLDGNPHFAAEETLLLPIYARRGDLRRAEIIAMLAQHVEIRRDALDVRLALEGTPSDEPVGAAGSGGMLSRDRLRALGAALREHIRFEEREVFPMIESVLTADDLALLARLLEAYDV